MVIRTGDLTVRYSLGRVVSPAVAFVPRGSAISNGGTMATNNLDTGTLLHNIWDLVTGDQSSAGYSDYRIVYVRNGANQEAFNVRLFIPTGKNWQDFCEMGVSATAPAGTVAAVLSTTDDSTAPTGITWSTPTEAAPLAIGNIPMNGFRALYLRRMITAGAAAKNLAEFDLTIRADTGE